MTPSTLENRYACKVIHLAEDTLNDCAQICQFLQNSGTDRRGLASKGILRGCEQRLFLAC
ncbi:hypothetical protein Mapa_002500 [Marchantia paleacea]|nr:hypothetical protein Mapa_002500 [Marchantia paleacea]